MLFYDTLKGYLYPHEHSKVPHDPQLVRPSKRSSSKIVQLGQINYRVCCLVRDTHGVLRADRQAGSNAQSGKSERREEPQASTRREIAERLFTSVPCLHLSQPGMRQAPKLGESGPGCFGAEPRQGS